MNTPEYQAISRNRHNLERFLHSFFKEISARLRDNDYLTVAQHDVVVGSTSENGCSKLVEAVLESIKIDSVTSFVEFIEISKSCGNRFFRNFIEEKIEAKRKEVYRSLFECSSGKCYTVVHVHMYCDASVVGSKSVFLAAHGDSLQTVQ